MQESQNFIEQLSSAKSAQISIDLLLQKNSILEAELQRVLRELYKLRELKITDEQLSLLMQEQLESLRQQEYGTSSERYKKPAKTPETSKAPPKPRVKKPSERYPNLPIREQVITQNPHPQCPCCNKVMMEPGMTEDSEQLTVIPKKYEILKILRAKYRCSCQGTMITAPMPPRIIPGSSYSDEMILDVVLTKYCDLIPIERYVAMANRGGVKGLPPHSLIELTHDFADFVSAAYRRIEAKTLMSRVLHADETRHRMLEGSNKKSWYLWGFSTPEHCFFECHDTRSGDVASNILLNSRCEILVTDVYSGYGKAIRIANEKRKLLRKPLIRNGNCNSHSRRYFFKAYPHYREAQFYLDTYHEIYQLDAESRGQPPPIVRMIRAEMRAKFEDMKIRALLELQSNSAQSKYGKALSYLIENYSGLTLFLSDPEVPIDNNPQERLLRNHVVGRKTWYGTHSQRGALTAAILFTLVESCKLCGVNPREYFKQLVTDLLSGKPCQTPHEYKLALLN